MDDIVVTSSRRETSLAESPERTEVLSGSELKSSHARDLQEALKGLSGVTFAPIRGGDGLAVSLQGLKENHTLILMNGIPLTNALQDFDLSQIPIAEVERVEVVKGASSALYGSGAMGGVVNIITKAPSKKTAAWLRSSWSHPMATKTSDSEFSPDLQTRISGTEGTLGYTLTGSFRQLSNYDFDSSTLAQDGKRGVRYHLEPHLIWNPTSREAWSLSSGFYVDQVTSDLADTNSSGVDTYQNRNEFFRRNTVLHYSNQLPGDSRIQSWLSAEGIASRQSSHDLRSTPYEDAVKKGDLQTYRAEIQWDQSLGKAQLFTAGLVGQHQYADVSNAFGSATGDAAETKDLDRKRNTTAEIYLQDEVKFFDGKFVVIPGTRLQWDPGFGTFVSPKIQTSTQLLNASASEAHWRTSIGRGYKVPSLTERYYALDHSAVSGYQVLGDPGLTPETSWSLQAGPEWRSKNGNWEVSSNFFWNRVSNLIDYRSVGVRAGLDTYQYQNIASVQTMGVESSMGWTSPWGIRLRGNYTFIRSTDLALDKLLPYRPIHRVGSEVGYQWGDVGPSMKLVWRYQGGEFIDSGNTLINEPWSTWDWKWDYAMSKSLGIFWGIDNLTDTRRKALTDRIIERTDRRPSEGRSIYFGLELKT